MPTAMYRQIAALRLVLSRFVAWVSGQSRAWKPQSRRLAIHHIYFILAAVDVFAVLGGVALSHHLRSVLTTTVSANLDWSHMYEQMAQVRRLAGTANAPGNDVFESKNPTAELERVDVSAMAYGLGRERLRVQLEAHVPDQHKGMARRALARIDDAFETLHAASREVLALYSQGRIEAASGRMAAMDRVYATLVEEMEAMTRTLRQAESEFNQEQLRVVDALGWLEVALMGVVVLIVLLVTQYGRRLEQKFNQHSTELNILNITLERRIAERTLELQEANAAIVELNAGLSTEIMALNATRSELVRSTALLKEQHDRFDAALQNMSQGLAWLDGNMSLIICNSRYKDMYCLPDHLTVAGTTFDAIFEHRVALNLYPIEMDKDALSQYHDAVRARRSWQKLLSLPDGRHILVSHTPMPNGGSISTHADVTEYRRLEEQVAFLAAHDALTGLPNRRRLGDEMETSFEKVRRGEVFALLCLDLDHFKAVNDTHGHGVGDKLLCTVADRLRANVRSTDVVARLGGDEFAVLVNGHAAADDVSQLASRLLEEISACYEIDGHSVVIGTSIGIAFAPGDGRTAADIFRNADLALYVAKNNARGSFSLYAPGMDATVRARRALELDLRQAVEAEAFEIHFQPLLDAANRTLLGFEALLRWTHPERGSVPPLEFIPLAEEIGLMSKIGALALKLACAEAVHWPQHLRVAVNVSVAQFKDGALERDVMSALASSGLSPGRLELEITESVLMECSENTLEMLRRLRNIDIGLAIDDFGTGYSSFGYLRHMPFSSIKIDRSFIKDVVTQKNSHAIVQSIVNLAQSLGLSTTAEGIETEEQLLCIQNSGCREVQGFLFSKPIPASEVRGYSDQFQAGNSVIDMAA